MDYYSMKRKQLQALCKQHNIPANSANSILADNLSQLLNEKQKPTTRQRTCLKSPIETAAEGEPAVSKKEGKKVRFSPNNDLLEYGLRSGKKNKDVVTERKGRRKSVANKIDKQVVNDNVELVDDVVQIPVRITRSRVQVTGKDGVVLNNEKKKGKKAAKDVEKATDVGKEPGGNLGKVTRSKVNTLNKDVEKTKDSVEGTVVSRVRVTRSKAQSLVEDGIGSDVNAQPKKRSGRQVAKDAHSVEPSREITDIPVRVTRTRGQILKGDNGNTVTNSHGEKKRTRKEMKSTDLRNNSSNVGPDDNQELPKRKSLRTRGVETVDEDEAEKLGRGKQKKRSKGNVTEVPESQHHADKGLRQSRRNVAKVEDLKVEIVNDKKVTRSKSIVEAVVNPTVSPKSRKRRGTPIVEDQTVETEYVSPADESPRRSAPSTSKSKGKSVAKKQVESSLKTPASRKNKHLDVLKAVPEVNKENSSKKRAKLSGTNQRYSENHFEKSSVKGTPVSKLGNFEPDIEVTDIESTPVIESHRRVTRSAIRTGGKEPSQSAIKEQPTGDAQYSSPKVARFRHDLVVNTAPGRVTRSGIKHGGNEASIFSEKVDKRKQLSQSAHRKQPFNDTQISLPEDAEVSPDVDTIGVQSEISKASESVKLPTIVLEENMVMENLSPVAMAEKPEVYETTPDAVSDGSHIQNETHEVSEKSTIFSEAVVQVALDSEKPMADENEMDLAKLGSTSKRLQIDLMAEEPAISVDKTGVMEENDGESSAVCHISVEQSDVKGKSKESEDQVEPSNVENVMQSVEDDGSYSPLAKESKQDDSVGKHEVADNGEGDDEDESVSVQNPLMNEPVSEDRDVADGVDALKIDDSDNKEDIITTGENLNEHGESSAGKSVFNSLAMDSRGAEFEVLPSTDNDIHEVPILGECDGEENIVYAAQSVDEHGELATGNDVHGIPITGGSDNKEEIVSAGQSVAEHGDMSAGVHEIPILGESSNKEDMVTSAQSVAKHGISLDRSDVAVDDLVDVGNDPSKKLEFEAVPSTGNDIHEVPILGKSDGEDEGAKVTKEGEINSMSLTDGNILEDPVMSGRDGDDGGDNGIDCDTDSLPLTSGNMIEDPVLSGSDSKAESNPKPLTDHDVSDTSFLDKEDSNTNRELESTLELSPANDIIESPSSNNDIYDDVPKELETTLEPANATVSINDVSGDFKNDRFTSNDSCAMDDLNVGGDYSDPAPNETTHAATEVSIRSCDQEPDQVFNVAAEVPSDTVGISASVGPFDSSTNIESPHTHAVAAITVDTLEESILDSKKEAVSNVLGHTYDTDTKHVGGNELKFSELDESVQPKESESSSPDMSKEQTSEKAEMTTGNDQEKHTVATFDPLDDTNSDLPTFLNEDDRDKQVDTSVDWGDLSIEMDEFHSPVAENESDDVLDKSRKDLPTSVGASSSSEENSRVAADMVNSVKNLGMASRNGANEKSSQEVDMLKENVNADITDEVFNWPDSSLKSFFKTPVVTKASHVKDGQEGVGFPSQDHYSSLKYLFETPATTGIGDVQGDTVAISNQDHCSSLAPATGTISRVKDDEGDAGRFAFTAKNGTAPHGLDHQWEALEVFDGETQGNATRHISENVTYTSIEDYSRKFFEDKVDHSSGDGSGKDKHFEFKGDQDDQTKQFDLSSEVAGTSHHHASGLKDNSIYNDELEKKEETQLKGSEPCGDLDFNKGI